MRHRTVRRAFGLEHVQRLRAGLHLEMRRVVADLDVEGVPANLALDEIDRPVRDRKGELGVGLDHAAPALLHRSRHAAGSVGGPAVTFIKADLVGAGAHVRAELAKVRRAVVRVGLLESLRESQPSTPVELRLEFRAALTCRRHAAEYAAPGRGA